MSEISDNEWEAYARNPGDEEYLTDQERALLRLLDAERARADAAEAKVADAWDEGARAATMDYGIGKATNPYRKA